MTWSWTKSKPCSVPGCDNDADPRWWAHGPGDTYLSCCDGHHELPCKATRESECRCAELFLVLNKPRYVISVTLPDSWDGNGSPTGGDT